jgi:putative protease
MKKLELLAPAGDLEKLKMACRYGADAVYIGGETLGMRKKARNFSRAEMVIAVAFAHANRVRLYVTANIVPRNDDFTGMSDYFKFLSELGVDGLIVSDPGVFMLARQIAPELELHISTQAGVTNLHAAKFWADMGASRVILARELSLTEIQEISRAESSPEVETFVHGAMCMAFSGRCLISNYLSGRDANGGHCSQPCRWEYTLTEKQSGEVLPVCEDEHGTFIFNSRDLCMVEHIPALVDAGISAFKIEGRMKTAYYVAAAVRTYRRAIDEFFADPALYERNKPEYVAELARISQRGYTTGFYFGPIGPSDHNFHGDPHAQQDFLAVVKDYDHDKGLACVEQRNKISVGDKIEILHHRGEGSIHAVSAIYDKEYNPIAEAPHPQQVIYIPLPPVQPLAIIRRAV